jgi:hypothetical protein
MAGEWRVSGEDVRESVAVPSEGHHTPRNCRLAGWLAGGGRHALPWVWKWMLMQMQMQMQMPIRMRLVGECIVSLLRAWSMIHCREGWAGTWRLRSGIRL